MTWTCTLYVERHHGETAVLVEYEYTSEDPGTRDHWGIPTSPPVPAQIEILDSSIQLSDAETEYALDAALDDVKRRFKAADRERYESP